MTETDKGPTEAMLATISDFYKQAFEDGRKQGFNEGIRAAQAYLANMLPTKGTPSWTDATPVEDLELTVRAYNCLKHEGLDTIGELVMKSERQLLDIRNLGRNSVTEVMNKLRRHGYSLAPSPSGSAL